MMPGNGQLAVPPGFRFHPTDEELLYYYLRKKISYEAIDLDVIREVDLNKLEPWDLKEKCRIGSGPQNEWYFFSHKDKKYPTGTRTNRATKAGFWKATGRDKAIYLANSQRIGMRKTLVFYTGRAPHGQKTDWIMHEYRLDDDHTLDLQEDGWVVCRVSKKKNHSRGFQHELAAHEEQYLTTEMSRITTYNPSPLYPKQDLQQIPYEIPIDGSMHLPQLLSTESAAAAVHHNHHHPPSFFPITLQPHHDHMNTMDMECSQNLLRLNCGNTTSGRVLPAPQERFSATAGDCSFLDKLLAASHNNQTMDHHLSRCQHASSQATVHVVVPSQPHRLPFQNLGYEAVDILKYSK